MSTPLELGLIVSLNAEIRQELTKVAELGLRTCQLACWDIPVLSPSLADTTRQAVEQTGVSVSCYWAGYSSGPEAQWNFQQGPATIGLVPVECRAQRLDDLKKGADFAKAIGAPAIATHAGFLPEDPNDPQFKPLVECLSEIAGYCEKLGLGFLFETGQETPVTLLRTIEWMKTPANVGINLDPANLILYGKANPVDALDVFGHFVKGLHAKDGCYPTDGDELGKETPLGAGRVDFPALIGRLKSEFGYDQPVTIEREISGEKQIADIKKAIDVLTPLL